MKRIALAVAAVATLGLSAWLMRCRHVNAKRTPLGGFRCPCGRSFASMPTLDDDRVSPVRHTLERDPLAVVRASGWVN